MNRYSDIDPMDIDPETGRPYSNYSSPSLDTSFHDGEMDTGESDPCPNGEHCCCGPGSTCCDCGETIPGATIYVQFSDCGQHIRKWSREPFEGGMPFQSDAD